MGALRRLLTYAFALVLLMQAGAGVAHCLRNLGAADGLLVEICAADGKRLVLLNAEGNPAEAPGEAGMGVCPVCAGLPNITLPAPPTLSEPVRFAAVLSFPTVGHSLPAPRARAPPYSTRAPPATA